VVIARKKRKRRRKRKKDKEKRGKGQDRMWKMKRREGDHPKHYSPCINSFNTCDNATR
jgi:hypothetical protein